MFDNSNAMIYKWRLAAENFCGLFNLTINIIITCCIQQHAVVIINYDPGTNPSECEADFPNIVKCMADGRDHLPCCLDQGIPEVGYFLLFVYLNQI